jgi:ribosomal subunit interface protein
MRVGSVDQAIQIQSSNIELGENLTQHARQKIETVGSKLFGRITNCEVHFRKEGSFTTASIRMKVGSLRPWAAVHTHINPYRAFNLCLDKIAVQMRQAKQAIRSEHGRRLDKTLGIDPISARVTPALARAAQMAQEADAANEALAADDYTRALTQASTQDRKAAETDRAWPLAAE